VVSPGGAAERPRFHRPSGAPFNYVHTTRGCARKASLHPWLHSVAPPGVNPGSASHDDGCGLPPLPPLWRRRGCQRAGCVSDGRFFSPKDWHISAQGEERSDAALGRRSQDASSLKDCDRVEPCGRCAAVLRTALRVDVRTQGVVAVLLALG
jgi:hypothetical protein